MKVLAFDLGGSRLKAGLVVDDKIDAIEVAHVPSALDASQAGDLLATLAGRFGGYERVGLCTPGLVENGVLRSLPGKLAGLEGADLLALLRERFGVPAIAENDAVAYATGEALGGAGAGAARVVVVTIGTGVGVTLVEDGRARPETILGGFIPISERTDGPTDSIGRADTIEALCSASRIGEDPAAVYARRAAGDGAADSALESYRANLVRALAALASAHAPERIVLGGGPMTLDNPITPGIADEVNGRMFGDYRVQIAVATLGDGAALVGLSHLVRTR